jgi:hypothetical protein
MIRSMPTAAPDMIDWLERFEATCRGRDLDAGGRLFAQDAVAFGT